MVEEQAVTVKGMPVPKPNTLVGRDTPIVLVEAGHGYVGRGALKLRGALDDLGLDVAGRRALDAGASTGGFTQVLLERGAPQVVALDVGYGQLDQRLREDERVVVMERTNLRHVTPDDTGGRFSLIVGDLSFISLCTVAPALSALAEPDADLVLLIKPQFEAPKSDVDPGGIVGDEAVRRAAVEKVVDCMAEAGLGAHRLVASQVAGAEGNREVFVWARPGPKTPGLEVPA